MVFSINKSILDGVIDNMESARKKIDPKTTGIHKPNTCQGLVLDEYVDRINKISQLLTSYKKLLETDVKDLKNSRVKLEEMDKKIGDIFKYAAEAVNDAAKATAEVAKSASGGGDGSFGSGGSMGAR